MESQISDRESKIRDGIAIAWLKNAACRWSSYSDAMPGKSAILAFLLEFEMETGIKL